MIINIIIAMIIIGFESFLWVIFLEDLFSFENIKSPISIILIIVHIIISICYLLLIGDFSLKKDFVTYLLYFSYDSLDFIRDVFLYAFAGGIGYAAATFICFMIIGSVYILFAKLFDKNDVEPEPNPYAEYIQTKERDEENDEKDLNRLNPNDPLELQIIQTIQLKRKIPTLGGSFKRLITGVNLFDLYYPTVTAFIEHCTTIIYLMQTRETTQYDIYKKLALLCYQEAEVIRLLHEKIDKEELEHYEYPQSQEYRRLNEDYYATYSLFGRNLGDIAGKYADLFLYRDIYIAASEDWKIKEQEWKKQYEQWENEQRKREQEEKEQQERARREKERQERQRQERERQAQEQKEREWAEFQQWKQEKERQEWQEWQQQARQEKARQQQEQERQRQEQARREKARQDYEEYQRAYNSYRRFYEENEQQQEENEEHSYSSLADEYAAILGVSKNATKAEIKKAYRVKIKEFHPDRHVNAPPEMKERLNEEAQKINKAYEYLWENASQ